MSPSRRRGRAPSPTAAEAGRAGGSDGRRCQSDDAAADAAEATDAEAAAPKRDVAEVAEAESDAAAPSVEAPEPEVAESPTQLRSRSRTEARRSGRRGQPKSPTHRARSHRGGCSRSRRRRRDRAPSSAASRGCRLRGRRSTSADRSPTALRSLPPPSPMPPRLLLQKPKLPTRPSPIPSRGRGCCSGATPPSREATEPEARVAEAADAADDAPRPSGDAGRSPILRGVGGETNPEVDLNRRVVAWQPRGTLRSDSGWKSPRVRADDAGPLARLRFCAVSGQNQP